MTLAEAVHTLLSGGTLKWSGFGAHAAGSIRLETPAARRVFEFLRKQPAVLVLHGSESLFPGLIAAWKDVDRDPAQSGPTSVAAEATGPWRLQRIEAANFGGLSRFGGEVFDMNVGAQNWCLEGQNGSGKTALMNAILWALTGQRVREHVGPLEDLGERQPVLDDAGYEIGAWPPLVAYPRSRTDLRADAEMFVRLTFVNADGELARAFRSVVSPGRGTPKVVVELDPRIHACSQFVEAGILMPARLSQMSFGERSQSLFEAVKRLTGLDPLADIAQGVAEQLAHNGRNFLKYAKHQGIDGKREAFDKAIGEVQEKCGQLGLDLQLVSSIESPALDEKLRTLIENCSAEAAEQIGILKVDLSPEIDLSVAAQREKVREGVAKAKVLLEEKPERIAVFATLAALTEAGKNEPFQRLPDALAEASKQLEEALRWHRKQSEDRKLRLKAIAAQWIDVSIDPACPLCEGPLTTPQQRSLAREMDELKRVAATAERRIGEACADIERPLRILLTDELVSRFTALRAMEPREAYIEAMRQRFVDSEPFTDVLTGIAAFVRELLAAQSASLPKIEYREISEGQATGEPTEVAALVRFISELRRLVALVEWWGKHRTLFVQAFSDLRGRPTAPGGQPAARSIRAQISRLEVALSKSDPYDLAVKRLEEAGVAATVWREIRAEQKVREEIRDAMTPLKELRLLVEAETARSISELSGQIEKTLDRIHLRERLSYRTARLARKSVTIQGALAPGMKIDATLIANTSWLRAILWSFILALREQTAKAFGSNPFPLLLLDDPQTTFDPRNKMKWAEELARLANLDPADPAGAQFIVTTHEHEFYSCLTEREKVTGEHGMLAPADEDPGVVTIVNGACLQRRWGVAESSNSDDKARDYIRHVRIHVEKLLKAMMRGEGAHIRIANLGSLHEELKQLAGKHVRPYDGLVFNELLKFFRREEKMMLLLSDPAHSDDETLGMAQARDVHRFWNALEPRILAALRASLEFMSFRGDARTFVHEPTVVAFPGTQRDVLKEATFIHTGIAAAAKTDGRAGDGVMTIEEWEASRARDLTLPNHDIYRLTAGTLEPVAAIGDLVIVSNYAKIRAPAIALVANGDRLLARRYNEMHAHEGIAVLTGQAINPYTLAEPIIVMREGLLAKKVVGTLFLRGTPDMQSGRPQDEFAAVKNVADYWMLLNGARLFKVQGRSAEPVALDGQYLITREVMSPDDALKKLDGALVLAIDSDGTKYFKRLRRAPGAFVILESLNPDGSATAELLSLDEGSKLPRLAQVLPVVGVLFELPHDS